MSLNFKIVKHMSNEWKQAVQLREEVLRKPLGTKFTEVELQEEKDHIQIIGILDESIIATTVLVPEIGELKMQRVVVKKKLRNGAIGSKMIQYCEKVAIAKGFTNIYCHARNSAIRFYSKNGYSAIGDYFDEDGIPHLKMTKSIR